MRRLLLLRHAKAVRLQGGGSDRDRGLEERGRADARTVGQYLARHGAIPARALVSSATRTRETWALLAAAFQPAPPVDFDDRLYEAAPETILGAINQAADDTGTLLVIGHNPGMQELAAMLIAAGDIEARERLGREFPTSALAVIGFAAAHWSDVHVRSGRLEHFVTPQWLAETAD